MFIHWVCVCVSVRVCVWGGGSFHWYLNAHWWVHMIVQIYVGGKYTCVNMFFLYLCILYIHTYIYIHTYTYIHTYIRTIHTYIHTHYTYIHTYALYINTYIRTIHKMSTDSDDTFQMSWSAEPVSCRVHCHIPFGWSSPQLEKKIWGWQRHSLRHGNTRCDVGIAEGLCFNSRKIIGKFMEIVGETDETLGSFSIRCWIGRVFSWVQVHGPRADIFRLGLAWT